ncbi:MAG: sensor histidine kinase [Myxococcaceae bacterium]
MTRSRPGKPPTKAELRERLREAEETLQAIRSGQVDAILVEGPVGEKIFTLEGAERSYRVLVEAMNEGALTLRQDGTILYCNGRFARLLGRLLEKVMGSSLHAVVAPEDREAMKALLDAGRSSDARGELTLLDGGGRRVPVYVSVSAMATEDSELLCLVVTDLTEQKRAAQVLASEQFAQAVLSQAGEAIVACDAQGRVLRASGPAHQLAPGKPLKLHFEEAFPLDYPEAGAGWSIARAALRGESVRGMRATLVVRGEPRHLLISGGPLWERNRKVIGCIVTLTDVTRLKAAEAELETAVHARDEFIAVASHELRTPLTALGLAVHGLERSLEEAAVPGQARRLSMARRQVERLGAMIERLLTVSRITTGRMNLDFEELDLTEVAREVLDRHRGQAEASGSELRLDASGPVAGVWDRTRLEQIVANLVSNAVKYAPGKPIDVTVEASGEVAVLTVADRGMGIASEDVARIFEKFERAMAVRQVAGLGLGLYITRQIVQAFGGSIEVSSRPGEGSIFTIQLPLRPSPRYAPVSSSGADALDPR